MSYVALKSSTLAAVSYEAEGLILRVRFRNGGEYEYQGVPEALYRGLLQAASAGRYFDEHIKKGGYRYRQIR